MAEPVRISPQDARRRLDEGASTHLVCAYDNEDKSRAFRLEHAITLQELEARADGMSQDAELIFYCACPEDASASERAREWLAKGFKKTKVLAGGVEAWKAAGFDLAQPAPKEALDHTPEVAPLGPKPTVPAGKEILPPRHEELRRAQAGAQSDVRAHATHAQAQTQTQTQTQAGEQARASAGGMKARDVMSRSPEAITSDRPVDEAARRMRDLDVGALPVRDGSGRFVGMITDRDLAVRIIAEGKDPRATKIADVLSGDLVTCDEETDVTDVARLMQERHVRRIPITRKGAGGEAPQDLVGIISLDDLATDLRVSDLVARTLAQAAGR